VIASASALVDAPGVLRQVHSQPPLTIRQIYSERPDSCALCLVGSAAGPLPGDELDLRIDIAAGADASLIASGATIAQGRAAQGRATPTTPARIRMHVSVGARATLDADPGALIVCAGAHIEVHLKIELDATATLRWRELIVLGRSGEPGGQAVLGWDVTRAGRPLLRQSVDLSDPQLTRWPGLIGNQRVLMSELNVGPAVDARTTVHSPLHVAQRLADHATLTTQLLPTTA
jgi:urease accessory protein